MARLAGRYLVIESITQKMFRRRCFTRPHASVNFKIRAFISTRKQATMTDSPASGRTE